MEGLVGYAQPGPLLPVPDVDRTKQTIGHQLAIGDQQEPGAELIARRATRVVFETPLGNDRDREPDGRSLAIEQPEPRVDGEALQRGLAAVVKSVHARDVVARNRCRGRNAEVFAEGVFGLDGGCEVAVGARRSAEAADGVGLELLFTHGSNIAAFGEAEHVLGIELACSVRGLARLRLRGRRAPSVAAKMTGAKGGPGNAWRHWEADADQRWKTMTRRPYRTPNACARPRRPPQPDQISDKDFGGRSGGMGSAAMSTLGANERTTICAKLTGLTAST